MKEEKLTQEESYFSISRREFLKAVGGGIIILFPLGDVIAQERRRAGDRSPSDLNAFLRIGADGRVTCLTGKVELGQGIITSLAQMLADELDVPVDSVDMVMGDTDLCPWDMGTFGSRTTRYFGPPLREAAAEARAILIELAAEHLKVDKNQLAAADGFVAEKDNPKRRVSYADLTRGKSITRHLDRKPSLKKPPDMKKVGKGAGRKDGVAKVTGKAQYAGDIRFPGMLYARILRPPAHGAVLKKVDVSGAKKVKDAVVVQDRDLIAVLHPYPDVAGKALAGIKADFRIPAATLDPQTIFKHLLKAAPEGETSDRNGDLREGEKASRHSFEATYFNQYVAHAPMETHTATAKIEKDRVTVWASTQTPFPAKDQVAHALGISSSKVRVIAPFVGGGFGGKSQNSQIIEAARLAKLTGKPVQVAWTRDEEFFYDTFRPAAIVKVRSGVNEKGELVLWNYENYFGGQRGGEQFYDIRHHREVFHGTPFGASDVHPFATGAWRAPGNNTNTFARESHIDVTAAKIGMDPLQFRLKNLKDERMIGVLKAAAEKFGWSPKPAPSGRGFGVACGRDSDAYVAAMAEVAVDRQRGKIQVKRVVCAQDMGLVINPEGARMQMEGCVTMGLGYALTEEIRFKGGEILDHNFDTYEIPRFSWVPRIETVLVENPEIPPAGGGEPAIICMGAVLANAVFDATQARLFELPMSAERVKRGLG